MDDDPQNNEQECQPDNIDTDEMNALLTEFEVPKPPVKGKSRDRFGRVDGHLYVILKNNWQG